MALQVQGVKRQFKLKSKGKDIVLEDPNPELTPDEVMGMMSHAYPELTTSTVHGPALQDDGTAVYEFKTTVGTKG